MDGGRGPSDGGLGPSDGGSGATDADAGTLDSGPVDPGEVDAGPIDAGMVDPEGDAPSTPVSFTASDAIFLNPERGFYRTASLANPGNLSYVRDDGKTLVYVSGHLNDYLAGDHTQDLPAAALSDFQAGFDAIRAAGLKAIVRFKYDDGDAYPAPAYDAPEDAMRRHIAQLAPLLAANEDVIFLLQAGLIGAWGEWHTSEHFVDGPGGQAARARIVDALLEALPASRRIALRYPAYKRMFYGTDASTLAELLAGDAAARVGHLNDCFVSSEEDVGTYQYEPMETLKAYLAEDTAVVPIGGETCAVHPRNACDVTTGEMARFHWTYVNDEYHQDVLARWESEGCRPTMERRLGYRVSVTAGSLPERVRPGGSFQMTVQLENGGYAAPTNARPVFLVLEGGGRRLTARLDVDVRSWLPGAHALTARFQVPADLAEGSYRLALWLPDAASSLRDRPAYAIRLANEGIWNGALGDNTLRTITIAADAPGGTDPDVSTFRRVE